MANAHLRPDGDPLSNARDLLENGGAEAAAGILEELITSGRGGLLAHTMLVQALLACGRNTDALTQAREVSQLFPTAAAAALALGSALLAAGLLPTAIAELQRALRMDPTLSEARYQLGCAWLKVGESENALREFALIDPDNAPPVLAQKIAQAEAARAALRSSAGYVRHLFDQFSADYDTRMIGQLAYLAPRILRDLAAIVLPEAQAHSLSILDLGCGTGLAGAAFADLARRLDGIDLSPAMIEKAHARGTYDRLIIADIETEQPGTSYDLIVAADTLVYLGDLEPVFRNAYNALKAHGSFLFTVERAEADYSLGPKRRWRHSEPYLRSLATKVGFELTALIACSPRTEGGAPVEGLAAGFRKIV